MAENTVNLIIRSATSFYNELKEDPNGRYRSWEYCYKVFHDARKAKDVDADYLSLQLAFYLASWECIVDLHFCYKRIIRFIFL